MNNTPPAYDPALPLDHPVADALQITLAPPVRSHKLPRLIAPVPYFGGKGNFLAKLHPFIPYTNTYVEPFGGGGSVLFSRRACDCEVYNDLNENIVNLLRVLREPADNAELHRRCCLTLYSRAEYKEALRILREVPLSNDTRIIRAWAYFVKQTQAMAGALGSAKGNGGDWGVRSNGDLDKSMSQSFATRLTLFNAWLERLRYVQIECKDALKILKQYDAPNTVFYLDPPYVASTRKSGGYDNELTDNMHTALVQAMLQCTGSITLSGYHSEIYEPLQQAGWQRQDFDVSLNAFVRNKAFKAGGNVAQRRVESIYTNPRCNELLTNNTLFK